MRGNLSLRTVGAAAMAIGATLGLAHHLEWDMQIAVYALGLLLGAGDLGRQKIEALRARIAELEAQIGGHQDSSSSTSGQA